MPIFNVNLTAEQMADLKARADKAGVPATEVVRRALWPIDTEAHPTGKGRKPAAMTASDSAAGKRRATTPKPRAGVRGSGHLVLAAPPTTPEPAPIRARAATAGAAPAVPPGVAAQQKRDEWLRKLSKPAKG